jgi:signal transduction histidine kinase
LWGRLLDLKHSSEISDRQGNTRMDTQTSSSSQEQWNDVEEMSSAGSRAGLSRYGVAIFTAILALIVRGLFSPLLGTHDSYHTAWAAIVFVAWYCGVGPAVVTTIMTLLGVWYWFIPPGHSFALSDPKAQITGMIGFLILSAFIIALGEAHRRSKERSERELRERTLTEKRLRARETELEALHSALADRVEERTADLNVAVEGLRQLSARLLQAQDDERRRLARELHDSVGQLLAAISMNISTVRSTPLTPEAAAAAEENARLVEQISREIRTMSHLLHPPLLDEVGLASALRWYIDGFSKRSKIAVELEIDGDFGRLPSDMEIAVFRMVQECLTNVHRHSNSSTAEVRITNESGEVRVEIRDAGEGIPLEKQLSLSSSQQSGVGFRGMRERIKQLGGALEIESSGDGTIVKAVMPIGKSPVNTANSRATADEEVA